MHGRRYPAYRYRGRSATSGPFRRANKISAHLTPRSYKELCAENGGSRADRAKARALATQPNLPASATLAGVARISMVIFSSCFCIVVSVPVVALRANRTDEVAALVQLSGIPFRAIAPKIGHPFTYIVLILPRWPY